RWFGDVLDDTVRDLVLADELKPRGGTMYWAGREPPAARVGLRTGSSVECQLVDADDHLVAVLDPADDADEHTQTREETDISILAGEQSVDAGAGTAHLGAVTVL